MAIKAALDKETKKAILDAREMINDVTQADANEAETGRRIERMFGSLPGPSRPTPSRSASSRNTSLSRG